jgi:ceramide glucosyltransferase
MRPAGHLGLIFTQGLPWSLAAIAIHPTFAVAATYLALYFGLRIAMTWVIGIHGLKQDYLKKNLALIPVWDALAFVIWVASFAQRSIRWRGSNYLIRDGLLVPAANK